MYEKYEIEIAREEKKRIGKKKRES